MTKKNIINIVPELAKIVLRYKKILGLLSVLSGGFFWLHTEINDIERRLKLVDSIPALESKFSAWAIEIDSTVHILSNEITTLNHVSLGELKARKVGRVRMFLTNAQEVQTQPSGGFIYDSKSDDLYEIFWHPDVEDYYKNLDIQKIKGGKLYIKRIKVFLEYDK